MTGIKRPIVVTQCHLRFGFNVAVALAQDGYAVVAGGEQTPTMCRGVSGVIKEFRYPNPFVHPEGYLATLTEQLGALEDALLIPVHEDVFVASYYHDRLPARAAALIPEPRALMRLHDKRHLSSLCEGLRFAPPRTLPLAASTKLSEVIQAIGLPFVVKPRFGEGTYGVIYARDAADIGRRWGKILASLENEEMIAQRYVRGHGVAVGVLMGSQGAVATSQHRRLREVPAAGGTSTARLVEHGGALGEFSAEVLRRAGYTGVAMCEFRVSAEDGTPFLLDINPRYWGGLAAHIAAGVRYPTLQVQAATGDLPPDSTWPKVQRVESRWLVGELRSLAELMIRGRLRDIKEMFFPTHGAPVIYEDSISAGLWPVAAQVKAYVARALPSIGGGGIREARARFFARVADEGLVARTSRASETGPGVIDFPGRRADKAGSRPDAGRIAR